MVRLVFPKTLGLNILRKTLISWVYSWHVAEIGIFKNLHIFCLYNILFLTLKASVVGVSSQRCAKFLQRVILMTLIACLIANRVLKCRFVALRRLFSLF